MSKEKKHIDDIINESFSDASFDNDVKGWSDISERLNNKSTIDNVVFKAYEETQSELPDGAWSDMNDSLDIDTVWKRLAKRKKRKPILLWWKDAGVIVAIGILIGQLYNYSALLNNTNIKTTIIEDSNHNSKVKTSVNKTNSSSTNSYINIERNITSSLKKDNIYSTSKIVNSINNETHNYQLIPIKNKKKNNSLELKEEFLNANNTSSKPEIIPTQSLNDSLLKKLLNSIKNEKNATLTMFKDSLEKSIVESKRKKITVGLSATVSNTWILDATTREGFSETSLVSNESSFGSSYGVYLDYALAKNFSISADFYINSSLKTRNYIYNEGNYITRDLKLEYYKFVIQANKNILLDSRKINTLHIGIGGYYALLNDQNNILRKTIKTKNDFLNRDYGVKIELGHHINFKSFLIGYGMHLDYGLPNIFKETEKINSNLNVTNTFETGCYLRLGLRL